VVTDREKVGEINGDNIYYLKSYKLVPISTNLVSMEQEGDDLIYLELIQQLLNQGDYYFSYSRDLTRSKQSQTSFIYGPYVPIWEQADDRFFKSLIIGLFKSNDRFVKV
jgi:phosphatidylinositol 4-phosphatase